MSQIIAASATYGLLKAWFINDVNKTSKEILAILKRMVGRSLETDILI